MTRVLLLALLLTVAVGCAKGPATTPVAEVRGAPAPSLGASAGQAPTVLRALAVLRTWDAARSEAWARGDPHLLERLYTRGSAAGLRDRAMLRAWVARGLRVEGTATQLLSVRELRRGPTSWTLRVTDRLVGGLVVGRGVRRELPRDQPTTRTVRLRLVEGRWRVDAVLPGGGDASRRR